MTSAQKGFISILIIIFISVVAIAGTLFLIFITYPNLLKTDVKTDVVTPFQVNEMADEEMIGQVPKTPAAADSSKPVNPEEDVPIYYKP